MVRSFVALLLLLACLTTNAFANTLDTAKDLNFGTPVTDRLTSGETTIYYHFTTNSPAYVAFNFSHANLSGSQPWRIWIFDGQDRQLISLDSYGADTSIGKKVGLPAGTFYVKVTGIRDGNYPYSTSPYLDNDYQLSVTQASGNYELEHNETWDTATPILLGASYTGNIQSRDTQDVDYYSFTNPSSGYVTLNFSHANLGGSQPWNIKLVDSQDREFLTFNSYGSDTNVTKNIGLPGGTYYVKIVGNRGGDYPYPTSPYQDNDYQLTVTQSTGNYEVELNETASTATPITLGTAFTGNIGNRTGGDVDYYSFTTAAGYVTINFSHANLSGSQPWTIKLVDSQDREFMTFNSYGSDTNLTKSIGLPGGTYYVKVVGNRGGDYPYPTNPYLDNDYQLTVTQSTGRYEVELNETASTATPITLGTAFTGNIANRTGGDVDYYSFTTAAGYVTINFSHANLGGSQPWTIKLVDGQDREFLSFDSYGSDTSLTKNIGLPAGTYFVKIVGNKGGYYPYPTNPYLDNDYQLTVTQSAGKYEVEFNETVSSATPITLGTAYTGNIGNRSGGDVDYYSFTTAAGYVTINFSHANLGGPQPWNIKLVDGQDREFLTFDSYGSDTSLTKNIGLPAGTYFVKIVGVKGGYYPYPTNPYQDNDYRLTVTPSIGNYEVELNETVSTATPITLGTAYTGNIGNRSGGDVDYYSFTTAAGYVTINFSHANLSGSQPWNVKLVDAQDKELMSFDSFGADTAVSKKVGVAAGTYYLKITGVQGGYYPYPTAPYLDNDYRFTVSQSTGNYETELNETATRATPVTLGTAYTGNIESRTGGDIDYYSFTIPASSYVTVGFSHANLSGPQPWSVTVEDDLGRELLSFNSYGTDTTISKKVGLAAGTYYVRIVGVKGGYYPYSTSPFQDNDYQLTVSQTPGNYETERNDTIAGATPVVPGTAYVGNMENRTGIRDVDYYKFTMVTGATVLLDFKHAVISSNATGNYWYAKVQSADGQTDLLNLPITGSVSDTAKSVALPAGTYFIKITEGEYNSDIDYSFSLLSAPSAPTGVSAAPGNAQATVSFSAPLSDGGSPVTSYTVTSVPSFISVTGKTSPITVTGLTNGTTYAFMVYATNAGGKGPVSISPSVTPAGVPGAPTAVRAIAENAQATVSFTAPTSTGGTAITNYIVTSTPGNISATGLASPITVKGLSNGKAYAFTVKAANSLWTSLPSVASNSVTPATVPDPPTGVSAVPGNGKATVSFLAPASNGGKPITSYTVTSNPGNFTISGVASPLTVTGLSNGTAYSFVVVATNAMGKSSPSGASQAVTPATAPAAPTAVSAVAGNAKAEISFSAPASDGGSPVTAYTAISTPGNLTGAGSASPITVSGLTNGTAYTFTVKATNAAGTGAASLPSASVTPLSVPGAPTGVLATAGNAYAVVSFVAPTSTGGRPITSYTVTSIPGNVSVTDVASPVIVKGLNNGTEYTFKVTATNAVGAGAASAVSNAVTPAAPDATPPTLSLSTLENGAVTSGAILNVTGAVSDTSGVASLSVNSSRVEADSDGAFRSTIILHPGVNSISSTATDVSGNQSTDLRTITLDPSAPPLKVAEPADNSRLKNTFVTVSGTIDPGSTVEIAVNGGTPQSAAVSGNGFSQTVDLVAGDNTLVVTATDLNGHKNSIKRSVICDARYATLAIDEPAEDVVTSGSVVLLKGHVADVLEPAVVTVSSGDETYTATVTGGAFEQSLTMAELKAYPVLVTVTDAAGVVTTVQRNVIRRPVNAIDPPVTPVNGTSQTVSGIRQSGTTVAVTCPGATIGTVNYDTENTWSVAVSGLREGVNVLTAAFTDPEGKTGQAQATIVVDTAPPANGSLAAVAGDGVVTLDWALFYDGSGNVTSYKVTSATGSAPSSCASGNTIYTGTRTGFVHGGLANGTTYYYRVCALDAAGNLSSGATAKAMPVGSTVLSIVTGTPLPGAVVGGSYDAALAAAGGTSPYVWTLSLGTLPAGLTLNSATGEIAGTPGKAQTANFTIQVKDSRGKSATKAMSLVVTGPAISTSTIATAALDKSYSVTFAASGGVAPYRWTIAEGSLPRGLNLNSGTGVLSGTVNEWGTFSFTVKVTDSRGAPCTKAFTLPVTVPALGITTISPVPAATYGTQYKNVLTASGGVAPYTWGVTSGVVPAGLTLDAATGTISGTPNAAGTFNFTVSVTDGRKVSATKALALTVKVPPLAITSGTPLPAAIQGTPYSFTVSAIGGIPAYTWSLASGTLPPGLSLDPASGTIGGTAATKGAYSFTVKVTDSRGSTMSKSFTLTVG